MPDLKAEAKSRSALFAIEPERLRIKVDLNPRDLSTPENVAHIAMLADLIEQNGFLPNHPISVAQDDEGFFVAHGECRWHAAMEVKFKRGHPDLIVYAVPERRGTSDLERILSHSISNEGKRLTPLEESINIKRAFDMGLTIPELARKLGKSQTYIAQTIDFQAAPRKVHEAVRAGKISATLAAQTVRRHGHDHGQEILERAVQVAEKRGKGHATAKDVDTQAVVAHAQRQPVDDIPIKVDGDVVTVRFGRSDVRFSKVYWRRLIGRLWNSVGEDEEPEEAPEAAGARVKIR